MKKRILALFMAQILATVSVAAPVYAADVSADSCYESGYDESLAGSEWVLGIKEEESTVGGVSDDAVMADSEDAGIRNSSIEGQADGEDAGTRDLSMEIQESGEDTGTRDLPMESQAGVEETGTRDLPIESQKDGKSSGTQDLSIENLKDLESDSGAMELSSVVEEQMEKQEEFLVGKPAAELVSFDDLSSFSDAVQDINDQVPHDYESEIVINMEDGAITDENGEALVGADRYVTAASKEQDAEAALAVLEENGYPDAVCKDGSIRMNDRYVTCGLFVMSNEPIDTRGAVAAVSFEDAYFLQYGSSDETAIAAEMLRDDPGVWDVTPNLVGHICTETSYEAEMPNGDFGAQDVAQNPTGQVGAEASYEERADSAPEYEHEAENLDVPEMEETWDEPEIRLDDDSEEEVGRYYKNASSYLSKAVSYMGIDRFLANSGSANSPVTVAVIDTGYDSSSACVTYDRVLPGKGRVECGQKMRDVQGHGTFVLNQIYEATNASVRLIPYKISDNSSGDFDFVDALSAIIHAVDDGANVINYSNGTITANPKNEGFAYGEKVLQYALDHKCYLVASAGNHVNSWDKNYTTNNAWPARSPRSLTISSILYTNGRIADYSYYGSEVDFAAPGGDASYREIGGFTKGNNYTEMSGTSMAAPYYTAIIANLKAAGRSYSSISKLISSLSNYCDSTLTSSGSYYVGYGCVNLYKAINRTITSNSFKDFGSRAYTGSAITPNPTVTYGGNKLKKGRDYELAYYDNVEVGTATIYVIGKGVYHNTAYRNFKITPRSIAKASVTTKYHAYSYTGSPRKPAVTVKLNGKTLTKGTDYTVTYKSNTGPGQATIVVTGKGNYQGTASCKFGISKREETVRSGYTYILVPKAATGRAVALRQGGMTNNTKLWINTKTCSEAQQFKITKNSDGTYNIRSMKCELAIDSYNGSAASGTAAVIRNYSKSLKSEKWVIKKCKDGSFLFVNKISGKVLSSENNASNHADVRMHKRSNSTAQRFYLERVSTKVVTRAHDGLFTLRPSGNTRYALDVPAASKNSGTKIQIYSYNGSAAQQFRFVYSGDGSYRIVNRNSGKVLMPSGSKATKGAAIIQGAWKGLACQRWEVKKADDGRIILHNCAGYYLELNENKVKNGVKLRLNTLSSANRFRWVKKTA